MSAWGKSWGVAWGAAWGAQATAPAPAPVSKPAGGGRYYRPGGRPHVYTPPRKTKKRTRVIALIAAKVI